MPAIVELLNGQVAFVHRLVILNREAGVDTNNDGRIDSSDDIIAANRLHDFSVPGTLEFDPLGKSSTFNIQILEDTRLEKTKRFEVEVFRNGFTNHLKLACNVLEVFIEDDDTAQTVIEADSDTVNENNDIVINLSPTPGTGDCDVGFPFYMEVTPSGDTAELVNAAARTVRIPPCHTEVAVTFATINPDEQYHPPRQVTFTVTRIGTADDFSTTDERLLLPQSPVTVTINDNDVKPRALFEVGSVTVDANEGDTVTLDVELGNVPGIPSTLRSPSPAGTPTPRSPAASRPAPPTSPQV